MPSCSLQSCSYVMPNNRYFFSLRRVCKHFASAAEQPPAIMENACRRPTQVPRLSVVSVLTFFMIPSKKKKNRRRFGGFLGFVLFE